MENAQVVEVELRVHLLALLIHGIKLGLVISLFRRRTRFVMGGVCVSLTAIAGLGLDLLDCLRVLIVIEQKLDGLVIFTAVKSDIGAEVSQEALGLLAGRFPNPFIKLSCVTRQTILVLIGAFEALLSALVVILEKFEEGLVRVEEHLVLLDVDVLGRDRVFAEISTDHDAERVLTHDVLLDTLHARQAP